MAAGNRSAPFPPRQDLPLPANDPRPSFVCCLFSAPPPVTCSPLAATLSRQDLGVLARAPLLGPSRLSPGGQHEPWKRGIGEENGGWDPPTWCS